VRARSSVVFLIDVDNTLLDELDLASLLVGAA
jgi:hypothetical protein